MAYEFVTKEFTPVGKGTENKTPYQGRQVNEDTWKHNDPAELVSDLLAITEGSFTKAQAIVLNGVNQYLRFKDAPGADPMAKLLAFAKKAGISAEDLIAKLS